MIFCSNLYVFFVEDTTIHERKHSRENISGKREKNFIINKNVKIR